MLRFSWQGREGAYVFVVSFGKDTPIEGTTQIAFSEDSISGEDPRGIRHFVYLKKGRIASIHLHNAAALFPDQDPSKPMSLRRPNAQTVLSGDPPRRTMLLLFQDSLPDTYSAIPICPHVYLVFDGPALNALFVYDVPSSVVYP